MATHFICQSTEPLPHNYPSGLAGRTHGAVSQYEVYNASSKAHTRFPPPGWDFSQSSEEDSLPLLHSIPQPELKNSSFLYDPDLCITPQKSKFSSTGAFSSIEDDIFKKPDANPDPDLTLTPMKALDESTLNIRSDDFSDKNKKQKVRFHLDESVTDQNLNGEVPQKSSPEKPYKPELYDDDADDCDFDIYSEGVKLSDDRTKVLDETSENARTVKYTVGKVNNQPVYIPIADSEDSNILQSKSQVEKPVRKSAIPKTQTVGQKDVKVIREKPYHCHEVSIKLGVGRSESVNPIAACRVPESTGAKRKVKVLRENQYMPKETEYTYPFKENAMEDYVGGEEHMFARPEYNSTLRMKVAAEKLKESSIDLETALQRKLQMSESTKTEINEKAASLVNKDGSTFSGLVSLNVPVDEMCKQAAQMKTARAKQVKLPKSKCKDHKEPDLMEFFSSENQQESVTLSMPGIAAPSEQLSTASHWRAFDLYRHNRVWERTGKM